MPRVADTENAVLYAFDRLLSFVYAYAAEEAHATELATLRSWATQLQARVHDSGVIFAFLVSDPQQAVNSAVTSTLNTLWQRVRKGTPPPEVDFAQVWLNKPPVLSGADLEHAHRTRVGDIEAVIRTLRHRMDHAFPPEAKPYVTSKQIGAILRHLKGGGTVPIHIPTLGRLMEQAFLREANPAPGEPLEAIDVPQIATRYIVEAENAFVRMVCDQFIQEGMDTLYPAARQLTMPLDRVLPWGALWQPPPSSTELLKVYVRLNQSTAIADSKFRASSCRLAVEPFSDLAFLQWVDANVPEPQSTHPSHASFYSAATASIQIDDRRLVDQAVMTARYDLPVIDLKENIRYFTHYLLHQRQRYCREVGIALAPSERDLLGQLAATRHTKPFSERYVLHDKSSILGQLVGIMDAELTRSAPPGMLRKEIHSEIMARVNEAGFAFSLESIRKACDRNAATRDAVYHQWVARAPHSSPPADRRRPDDT
jgi:hypothetical protein